MRNYYFVKWAFYVLTCFTSVQLLGQDAVTVAGTGRPGKAANQLLNPWGIFLDTSGNLFIADRYNARIQKYTPGASSGITVTAIPTSTSGGPADVFGDLAGNLYIADDLDRRILEYSPATGILKTIIASNSQTTFTASNGIFVDRSGNIFFVDNLNMRILEYAPGGVSPIFTLSLNTSLADVFVDQAGNIYVSEDGNHTVLKFAPGNQVGIVVAGGNGQGSAPNQLNAPNGIFVDPDGNVYVADMVNNRVQKWAPGAKEGLTVAGGNGLGDAANQLYYPRSVVVDKSGYIYVSDYGNFRVQKFRSRGLTYKYYEGSWSSLPDFTNLGPVRTGTSSSADIGVRTQGRDDNFAFVWQGYLSVPAAGNYTFETVSDDGSRFYFNTLYNASAVPTVDNDGEHAPTSVTRTVYVPAAGSYPIAITYFERDGGQQMQVFWSGPGIERQLIPDVVFSPVPPAVIPPQSPATLSYKYYEGGFDVMPDFNTLTPVQTGSSSNFDIGIRRAGVDDSFAIVWDGFINIPVAGTYTFETISDDGSKLYFNGATLVNNDSTHPLKSVTGTINIASPGRYPIRLAYFENYGDQGLQVFWTGPGFAREQIPDPAFVDSTTLPVAKGLNYKYYEGNYDVLPDFNAITPLRTGISANADLSQKNPGVDTHFAFIWQGYINLPASGSYIFETLSDDGSRIYFNTPYSASSNSIVNNDGVHPGYSATGTVTVSAAGLYPIVITYFQKESAYSLQLFWSGPGIARQIIPDNVFSPTVATPPPPSINVGLGYKYYEGDFDALPDFTTLTPVKVSSSANVDINQRTQHHDDYFAFLWQGYINIPTAGAYTFETLSDDGSKLYFNSLYNPSAIATVNNDGLHQALSVTGTMNIAAGGWYPITISFFEKSGSQQMEVYWSGPGFTRQRIPDAAFAQQPPAALTTTVTSSLNNTTNTLSKDNPNFIGIYPNPFRAGFNLEFYNSSAVNDVQVAIYDLKGTLIYTKNNGKLPVGNMLLHVTPDGGNMPAGIYVAKLRVNGLPLKTVKLVKMK